MQGLIASVVVAVLGGGVLWQATDGLRALTAEGARRLRAVEAAVPVPATGLTDRQGQALSLRPGTGKTVLTEFIYTSCPTICRTAGIEFARLRNRLEDEGLASRVRLISVSFDPARDDAGALGDYADTHGADGAVWTVARPIGNGLPGLLDALGIVVIPDGAGGFEHNAAIHLIRDDGRLAGIFDLTDADGVVASLRRPQ